MATNDRKIELPEGNSFQMEKEIWNERVKELVKDRFNHEGYVLIIPGFDGAPHEVFSGLVPHAATFVLSTVAADMVNQLYLQLEQMQQMGQAERSRHVKK